MLIHPEALNVYYIILIISTGLSDKFIYEASLTRIGVYRAPPAKIPARLAIL